MILTLAEAKTLIPNLTNYDDADIERWIPLVQYKIISLTQNDFTNPYQLGVLNFRENKVEVVTNNYGMLFKSNDDVFIKGSVRNNGHWTITSVDNMTLTISGISEEPVYGGYEFRFDPVRTSSISLVEWPDNLPRLAARMIDYHLNKETNGGDETPEVSSFTRGDVSTSYAVATPSYNEGIRSYPSDIVEELRQYRRVKVV